jgi:proteasome lid subunit RPN8/RPN11
VQPLPPQSKRYEADLLSNGLIAWNSQTFTSPYAWASQCKNETNPDHKSGIGWGHIRYKGIKLSQYKTLYLRKHNMNPGEQKYYQHSLELSSPKRGRRKRNQSSRPPNEELGLTVKEEPVEPDVLAAGPSQPGHVLVPVGLHQTPSVTSTVPTAPAVAEVQQQPMPVQIQQAPADSFIDCTAFEVLGLQQPFTVSVSSNVHLLMTFHSHLSSGEVAGYLGGRYSKESKSLEVLQAFPCQCDLTSSTEGPTTEREIQSSMASRGLTVVGWYHSHPYSEPRPSQNDVLCHKKYQDATTTELGEEPCIGLIISPNLGSKTDDVESKIAAFWVLTVQQDGVKISPMEVKCTVNWEQYLTQDIVDDMDSLASYYKSRPECPNFGAHWKDDVTFIKKLKVSLAAVQPKFPQENSDETFMSYIEQLVL